MFKKSKSSRKRKRREMTSSSAKAFKGISNEQMKDLVMSVMSKKRVFVCVE